MPRKARPGYVIAGPLLDYYALRKQWASTWMLVENKADTGDNSLGKRPPGLRPKSFTGVFDVEQWCTYCGIERNEYDALQLKLRRSAKGEQSEIATELADRLLTNLGRPDLFNEWFGDQVIYTPNARVQQPSQ